MSIVGTVLRSHAGGYLVHVDSRAIAVDSEQQLGTDSQDIEPVLFCQARGRLKKEKVSIVTGDRVELDEIDFTEKTAVIVSQLERRSLITRPTLANVDQVVIVQAVKQPDFSPLWTDRYIVHFQLAMPFELPLLCFNKCDLVDKLELDRLRSIYEPLGYFVIFVSAKTGEGLQDLAARLVGKTSMFAGPSGVGKSSLLNVLCPGLNLKVGLMENDFGVGRHTTTYSELYRLGFDQGPGQAVGSQFLAQTESQSQQDISWIADTPGFNLIELLHPEPRDVARQFFEIEKLGGQCRFANCLHVVEAGCAVLALLNAHDSEERAKGQNNDENSDILTDAANDEEGPQPDQPEADQSDPGQSDPDQSEQNIVLHLSRYESYAVMVAESQIKQAEAKVTSHKVEGAVKSVGGGGSGKSGAARSVPRLANRYRATSRRKEKQKLNSVPVVDLDEDHEAELVDDLRQADQYEDG